MSQYDAGTYTDPGANGGGGGGNGSGSDDDKKRKAIDFAERVAFLNQNALNDKFTHGNQMYDVADQQAWNEANKQIKDNIQLNDDDWFKNWNSAQKAANDVKSSAELSGSNLFNFFDMLGNTTNDITSESLSNQREQADKIYDNLFETLAANVNARNELAMDTEYGHRQIANDFLANAGSIDPDIANEKFDPWTHAGDNFFNGNLRGAQTPTDQGFYLEDNAKEKASEINGKSSANASAANGNYFNSLLNSYNKRR